MEVAAHDGMVLIRNSKAPQAGELRYTSEEFLAFARGIIAGEFSDLYGR